MPQAHKRFLLLSVLFFFVIVLAAAAVLFSYQKAYAGKIYKNVYFADIDLSGKTKIQAEYLLRNYFGSILDKEITLSAGDKVVRAKLSDTGLTFDINQIISQSYSVGRQGNFFRTLFHSTQTFFKKNAISAQPFINQTKFDDFSKIAIDQLNSQPADATLAIEKGEIKVQNSSDGRTVMTDSLDDQIINMVNTNEITIELETIIAPAKIKGADFAAAQAQAQSYLNKKITFSYNGNSYQPSSVDIGNWITFINNNGQYSAALNDSNVKAYLNNIARNFEVKRIDTKVDGSTGALISQGTPGLILDKDNALASLKNQLGSSIISVALVVNTDNPQEVKVLPNTGLVLGRFEGKYLDIDLKTQTLCRVESSTLIDCFTVSSGKASMPTPEGTFHIQSKNPRQWSSKYGLWMPWWQEFNGPYGIHELPEWPNGYKEGEAHLGTPVSHGCVRLGVGSAETAFNWTDIGTTVFIHK